MADQHSHHLKDMDNLKGRSHIVQAISTMIMNAYSNTMYNYIHCTSEPIPQYKLDRFRQHFDCPSVVEHTWDQADVCLSLATPAPSSKGNFVVVAFAFSMQLYTTVGAAADGGFRGLHASMVEWRLSALARRPQVVEVPYIIDLRSWSR
jgi:hypothetical protein